MNPYYELPNLPGNFQRAQGGRAERPGRQLDELASIGALKLIDRLERALRRSFVGDFRRRRAAIRELEALSDRQLADIGIERSEIASKVEESL